MKATEFRNRVLGWRLSILIALWSISAISLHADERVSKADENAVTETPAILAHYMPWYTARPYSDRWGWHWTMNHFDPEKMTDGQRHIASKYYPTIGPYDSGDPEVLEYHLLLMRLAGLDGVIVDWYGLTDFNDYKVLHRNTTRVLQQCERLKMKFVICYEDQTIPALVNGKRISNADRVQHAVTEIQWLNKYWFQSPSYLRRDGEPVLLSFGHNGLTKPEWKACLTRLEFPLDYFSQDDRRPGAVGAFGWPSPRVGMEQVDRFLTQASNWPASVPAAFPRFVDIYREAGVSDGFPTIEDRDGVTLQETLKKAVQAENVAFVQIATWNDWGEGTQIEPSVEFGDRDLRWIQSWRSHRWAGADQQPLATDLSLPIKILRLRRSDQVSNDQLDRVVDLIVHGDFKQARLQLAALSE